MGTVAGFLCVCVRVGLIKLAIEKEFWKSLCKFSETCKKPKIFSGSWYVKGSQSSLLMSKGLCKELGLPLYKNTVLLIEWNQWVCVCGCVYGFSCFASLDECLKQGKICLIKRMCMCTAEEVTVWPCWNLHHWSINT